MTLAIPATCPRCRQTYAVNPDQIGQLVQCARCNQPFMANALPPSLVGQMSADERPKTSGMAVASLVLGLIVCLPIASLLAIIFGIIALMKTKDPRIGGKGMAVAGLVLGIVGLLLVPMLILLPALNRARVVADRVRSAQNLRQIGQACVQYGNSYNQNYPPDLGILCKAENLSPQLFVAPNSQTAPPGNLTGDAAVNWVDNFSDYIYTGSGMKFRSDPSGVVAYEKEEINNGDGINILFMDGHVEFLTLDAAHGLFAQNNSRAAP
jgi:predicted Zn finger-like uncharacterized protein/prepilin-type processing-associated H-X9-DG protein